MKNSNSERRFTERIAAMTGGLTFVILGATVLNLPPWSAAMFIPFGIFSYILGLRWYRQSDKSE